MKIPKKLLDEVTNELWVNSDMGVAEASAAAQAVTKLLFTRLIQCEELVEAIDHKLSDGMDRPMNGDGYQLLMAAQGGAYAALEFLAELT